MKTVLILGVGGQDGSYLADLLVEDGGWNVHGLYRRSSYDNLARVRHLIGKITLHRGDLTDEKSVQDTINSSSPDVVFNVADQDNIPWGEAAPNYQRRVTVDGVVDLLRTLHQYQRERRKIVRVFQPLSCTMFSSGDPQNEGATVGPASTYARCKAATWDVCRYWRRGMGMFVSCGIMFGHDSPRRSPHYLLQKVCRGAVAVAFKDQETIPMGALTTRVDLGHAREFMMAAIKIMSLPTPDDYCVGTGIAWSIEDMLTAAFNRLETTHAMPVPGYLNRVTVDLNRPPAHSVTYRACTNKLESATGWKPTVHVGHVINELIDHFVTVRREGGKLCTS